MARDKETPGPLDPFRKLLTRAEPRTVSATRDQITEFGSKSLLEKFGDFAQKQPALAFKLLHEAEQQPNGEKIIELALMVYYSVEAQMQSDLTKKKFPET